MNKKNLEEKLQNALNPTWIEVVDESHLHAHHAGVKERGGSHFNVTIVSDAFIDKNKIARQRIIFKLLAEELENKNREGIHALRMQTLTVNEWKNSK